MPVVVLRKGLIVRNERAQKRGVVIDWGTLESRYRQYMLARRDDADAVRVWTSDNIEVWPLSDTQPENA